MNTERGGACREFIGFMNSHPGIPQLLLSEWNVMAHLFLSLLWAAVNALKLSYTLLKHHQYGHKKKNYSWVCPASRRVEFLPLQPASRFLLQLLLLLRKDKTPPMALPVNFLPGNPEAVTSFRAWRGQLWIVSGRMSWDLRSWGEVKDRKKKKRNKTPFLFHFPEVSLTPFHFETKMCKSRVLEWEDGLNSQVWG